MTTSIYPFSANPFVPDMNGNRATARTGRPVVSVRWAEPVAKPPSKHNLIKKAFWSTAILGASVLVFRQVSPTHYAKLSQGLKDNLPALASQADKVKEYAVSVGHQIQNSSLLKSTMDTVKPAYTSVKEGTSKFFKSIFSK